MYELNHKNIQKRPLITDLSIFGLKIHELNPHELDFFYPRIKPFLLYTLYMKTAKKIYIQHTPKTVKKSSYTIYVKNSQISKNHIQIYANLSTIWYHFWILTEIWYQILYVHVVSLKIRA